MEKVKVIAENRAGLAVITLNRPEVHNAVDEDLRTQLGSVMARAAADPEIGAVVLTGAGSRAFCAGMDLREFAAASVSVIARRRQRRARANPLADFPKPLIAAVNGAALGLGLELILQCDIVIAAANASFALAEVRRGIIPGNGGTQRLARRIGQGRAMELILTGRTVDAASALAYGLVEYVVPAEELLPRAEALAREILANAPVAVQLAREAVRRGFELPLAEGLRLEDDLVGITFGTEDAREGPLAFSQKRPPRWRGE
ncbi:enoyl-CoA hydratase/isomerase family protein [Ottowia sp. VDI28]|uniref:enoyl-CoA hydratase/isomerase family protein n=1 Tax=Ottowia sp. VDI28 TaxID=3133968 RepID=UPI003C2ED724